MTTDKLEAWTRTAANEIAAEFARSECAGWIETIIQRYASRASVAAPPPDAAIFTDDELEYLYLQTDVDTDPDLFRQIEKKIRRQIARYREFDRKENMNRLVFSEEESNATAAAPTNAACPKCGGTRPTCCSCPSLVAATVDAETPPFRHLVGSSRHPHFTAADRERMKKTLDALSEYPTEEEAEAVLQAAGTSGKEVANGFIERLLRENLELKTKLNTARRYSCSCGGALTAEEYIEHYFEKGHDQGKPGLLIKAAAAEIAEQWSKHDLPPIAGIHSNPTLQLRALIEHVLSKRLGFTAVGEQWFDLALRYLRGDPELTDVPYSSDSVFAEFLRFWDAQTPHFRSTIKSVFQAAPKFTTRSVRCVHGVPEGLTCNICGPIRNDTPAATPTSTEDSK